VVLTTGTKLIAFAPSPPAAAAPPARRLLPVSPRCPRLGARAAAYAAAYYAAYYAAYSARAYSARADSAARAELSAQCPLIRSRIPFAIIEPLLTARIEGAAHA
jgi:hypothetical protein